MRHSGFTLGCTLLVLLLASAPTGCTISVHAQTSRSVYVARPPPHPLPETKSGAPAPGMEWIAGYWHFNGTDYVWIPGHWESPRPGWTWRPPSVTYSAEHHLWAYELGRWEPSNPDARR